MKKGILALAIGLCIAGASVVLYMARTQETNETSAKKGSAQGIEGLSKTIQERTSLQYERRRLQLSIAIHEKILKAAPDNPDTIKKLAKAYYSLGMVEKRLGDETASQANIAKAHELDPHVSDTP